MKITKQELLKRGFVEHFSEEGPFYVKGKIALVYRYNIWIPCYYSDKGPIADRLYIENIEELDALMNE